MNGKKVVTTVMPIANKIISDLGYTLVDVEYKHQVTGMVLELFIDSENGISINDCEKVSKALDEPLDKLNPTDDIPYSLNVSSLGLDRPITTEYQLNKYKGKDVELKFYEPLKPYNKKQIEAILDSWNNDEITVDFQNELLKIERKKIAHIVPVIKF